MSAENPPPKEGWDVPAKLPLLALAGIIGGLAALVSVGGFAYDRTIEPRTQPPAVRFPAPGLERTQAPPDQPRRDRHQPPPAGIERAMAETTAQGNALWGGARP